MRRLSEEDKNIIREAKYCQIELAKLLKFTPHTIKQFTDKEKIVLPVKRRSSLPDLTNMTFGRLYVIKKIWDKKSRSKYECKCQCGNIIYPGGFELLKGTTKSCGCWQRETVTKRNTKFPGSASAHMIFINYKNNAIRHNREFSLTEEEFLSMSQLNCFYCNIEPHNNVKKGNASTSFTYNGIDRIDNEKGYIKDNIVPCCSQCNVAKGKISIDEFRNWIKKVFYFIKEKENE